MLNYHNKEQWQTYCSNQQGSSKKWCNKGRHGLQYGKSDQKCDGSKQRENKMGVHLKQQQLYNRSYIKGYSILSAESCIV